MLRYLFGAYEPLDDRLAVLRSDGPVVDRKLGAAGHVRQHNYYLQDEYQDAPLGSPAGSIADRASARLARWRPDADVDGVEGVA